MENILEQALEIVEEVEAHACDLDEYDVVAAARMIVASASVDYDAFAPNE